MPELYEQIRDRYIRQGMSTPDAKTLAAKIYNKNRKPGQRPVTRNYEKAKSTKS